MSHRRRGREPLRAGVWGCSCPFVLASTAGDFSTTASPSLEMTLRTNVRGRTRQGTPAGEYLRVYRYAMIIFAPALVSAALEMTVLSTVPQGWRRGEGVPPYRSGFTPAKVSLYSNGIPLGGRGRSPLPHKASPWGEAVAKRLMRGCLLRSARHNPTPHPSCLRYRFGNPPPSSQHSCFTALAKNSHLWTVFTVLRTAASRPQGGRLELGYLLTSFRPKRTT